MKNAYTFGKEYHLLLLLEKTDGITYLKSRFANVWMGGIKDQMLIKPEQCLKYQVTAESIPSNEVGRLQARYLQNKTDRLD